MESNYLGLNRGSTTCLPCDLGQNIESLCSTQCPLYKTGMLTVLSSWSTLKIKWVNMCKALSMAQHTVSAM